MIKKIYWHQLGCTKNQVDGEKIIYNISKTGVEIVVDIEKSDIIVVNTCGFIEDAKKQSLDDILEFVDYKRDNPNVKLYVMGCLVERYIEQLKKDIPEVDQFFAFKDYKKLENILRGVIESKSFHYSLNETSDTYYVKISEGCNNMCSYCAIPLIRGSFKAFAVEDIVEEVKFGLSLGYKEIVLIGQDLAYYNYEGHTLVTLMQIILDEIKEYFWLRIMYLHPKHLYPIKEEIANLMKNDERVCKYLDIPIQHISDTILDKMNRRHTADKVFEMIKYFKSEIPYISLRSSIIVGFPGETQNDFDKLLDFINSESIDRLGFFGYSKEDDTKAYDFEGEVSEEIILRRLATLEDAQAKVVIKKNQELIGKEFEILVEEKYDENSYSGRSQYEAPEIDNLYHISSEKDLIVGKFYKCKIVDVDMNDYFAEVIE